MKNSLYKKMKRLLLTGFEPFGGEVINPSWEAVSGLPERIGEYEITRLRLPVVFGLAAEMAISAAEKLHPHAILCIGQAGGRSAITPELLGVNLRYAKIPDNAGNQPKDEPVIPGEREAYFSTACPRKMTEAIGKAGVKSELSMSAGAYVCNDLFYSLLAHFEGSDVRVGFIHIPYSSEQGREPSIGMSEIMRGLTAAIESLCW